MKSLFMIVLVSLYCAGAQAQVLTDPTKPDIKRVIMSDQGVQSAVPESESLKLTAIINSAHQRVAIINGKSFSTGQQIQGYQVISISQNHVILDGSEGNKTLYVNNNNVKKDTSNGY